MINVIKSNERHYSDFGWLQTYWHFSFGDYWDPTNEKFGALRVFNDDVVPQLPPKASGEFRHFGTELRYRTKSGAWSQSRRPVAQLSNLLGLTELIPSFLARQVTVLRGLPFHASLSDHLPAHYLDALTPHGVRTEFGD